MTKEEAKEWIINHYGIENDGTKQSQVMNYVVKMLEQEPCEDAISRQAVQDYVAKYLSQYLYNDVREAVEVIDEYIGELPPVTPQPKTGHWIYSKAVNTGEIIFSECSVCGNGESRCAKRMNYCPNCGAKMAESEGNNG